MNDNTLDESKVVQVGTVTVTTRATPLVHDFDEAMLGEAPAHAIKDAIAEGIRGVTMPASEGTMRYRAEAARAYAKGARWATERYSKPPDTSDRLFNDSGELADGLEVVANGDAWDIVAPADRIPPPGADPSVMLGRLAETVPALADPLSEPAVSAAIEGTWGKMVRR